MDKWVYLLKRLCKNDSIVTRDTKAPYATHSLHVY